MSAKETIIRTEIKRAFGDRKRLNKEQVKALLDKVIEFLSPILR